MKKEQVEEVVIWLKENNYLLMNEQVTNEVINECYKNLIEK